MRWMPVALLLVVGCRREHVTPPIAADKGDAGTAGAYDAGPLAVAPADAAPEGHAPPEPPPTFVAWTDPEVVAELSKSCRFSPPKAPQDRDVSPLSCEAGMFEQSCLYDPCFVANEDTCKPKCKRGCESCAVRCTSACESCKRPCADEACNAACATTCGACRQACLEEKDRCLTGTCVASYTQCKEKWVARYEKSACRAACPKFKACFDDCLQKETYLTCVDRCSPKVRSVCPPDLFTLCEAGGS